MPRKRIFIYVLTTFVAGTVLLIYIQYNSLKNIHSLISSNQSLLEDTKINTHLCALEKNVTAGQARIRAGSASGESAFMAGLNRNMINIEANLDHLQKTADADDAVAYIERLDMLVRKQLLARWKKLDSFNVSGESTAQNLIARAPDTELTDSVVALIQLINGIRERRLAKLSHDIDENGKKAQRLNNVLSVLALTIAALLFWYIIPTIRRQQLLISQLDQSERMVKNSARIKENFLANMSHEIRTPLNAILGFTDLLQRRDLDSKSEEYVQIIQRSGENLLTIVNDILDLSKIEAGMMRIEAAPFNIRRLAASVEAMFLMKAKEKGLKISAFADHTVPEVVEGDAIRLTQVLINLAGNSLKFTHQGSISIRFTNEGVSNHMVNTGIIVTDTGIGIEKEKIDTIFDRFKQADESVARKYGGSGLGLSIVKDLVLLMRGSIKVESEPGKGTTFKLIIPHKISPESTLKTVSTASSPETTPDIELFRILVAEDNEINQTLIKHLFTEWHLTFDFANTGKQAVEALKTKRYDLVLMDIQMREMDGYTATNEIRNVLKLDTPIVAMTAHALVGEREKCLGYGMNEYISKPMREDKLHKLINHFIQLKSSAGTEKPDVVMNGSKNYTYIDPRYMKEVANGNTDYEQTVTKQFINAVASDLEQIENYWQEGKIHELRQAIHNLRTTVSVMGLNYVLQTSLDVLEYENLTETEFVREFKILKTVGEAAVGEAKQFFVTLV